MSFELSPETVKFSIDKQIEKLQKKIDEARKKIPQIQQQKKELPSKYNDVASSQGVGLSRMQRNRYSDFLNKNRNFDKNIASQNTIISDSEKQIKNLNEQLELVSRETEVRNRTVKSDNSVLNNLKNINNEVIGQTMQNEDLRNKIIIGGVALGGLALFSGIIFKKKRSRK